MINQKSEYEIQANEFLTKTGTTFKAVLLSHFKHFPGDTENRDVYEIMLSREGITRTVKFGQSISHSDGKYAPTAYYDLACITKK